MSNSPIPLRLEALRKLMKERELSAYLIPTDDPHSSEYVAEHFAARKYMSGFTGSAGTLVVTADKAGLWTDARYFQQAERQLEGSGITLYRMREPGVPTLFEFLKNELEEDGVLGVDGRVITASYGRQLESELDDAGASLECTDDLVGMIWDDRPALPDGEAILLPIEYAGVSAADKLSDIRGYMREKDADIHVMTVLSEIAWLFNMRGSDVAYNPVVLSYAIIEQSACHLFVDESRLSSELRSALASLDVTVHPYESIYEHVLTYDEGISALMSTAAVNYALYDALNEKCIIIDGVNPVNIRKAVKNPVEMQCLRDCHEADGVAMVKFMHWLKNAVTTERVTELDAIHKLDEFRLAADGNKGLSFNTIGGYGAHAALMHYDATKEPFETALLPRGFYLFDSGGQYFGGTTDVTRTVALGPLTDDEKRHYTAVLRGMLALSDAVFPHGATGKTLDCLARMPLWELCLDYKHGTGHGIGCYLSVHEGPNSIMWRTYPGRSDCVLEEGMVTSNEPGYYEDGRHGIRIENAILCVKDVESGEYGQFMRFETLTLAPIDTTPIMMDMFDERDRARLNAYHATVYERLSPLLSGEELEWLREATREI